MSESDRFVALELVKLKLAPQFAAKKKVFGYLRGKYAKSRLYGNEYKGKSQRIRERTVLTVPYDVALEGIYLHVHEEMQLGFGYVTMDTLASCLQNSLDIIEIYLLHETTNEKIGKVYFNIYSDEKRINPFISAGLNKENNEPSIAQSFHDRETISFNNETTILRPPNDFKFHKLNKQIYWDRIKIMNINKITQNNDISTLFECIEDITKGDISGKINDDLATTNSVQLAQYSTQYLLKCYSMLQERESLLKSAYKAFIDEDEVLDEKLAKYTARKKALSRENKFLNDLHDKNLGILHAIDPKVGAKYAGSSDQISTREICDPDLSNTQAVMEGRVISPSSRKSSPPKAFVKSIITEQDFTEAITSSVNSIGSPIHEYTHDGVHKSSAHSSPNKAESVPIFATSNVKVSNDWKSAVQSNSIPVTNSVQTFTSNDLNTSYDSIEASHDNINEQIISPKVIDTEYHILNSIKSHAKDNFVSVNTLSTGVMSLDSLNINNPMSSVNIENSFEMPNPAANNNDESVMLEDLEDLEDVNFTKNPVESIMVSPHAQFGVEGRKVVNNRYQQQDNDDIFNHHSVNTSRHEDDVMGFDLSASLDTSTEYIKKPDGLRTGVINYLNRGSDEVLNMTGPSNNIDSSNDDVLIGTNKPKSFGNTGSSYTFSDFSAASSVENMEDKLARDIQNNNKEYPGVNGQLEWLSGRSPLDNIEVGQALDVLVSGIRLENATSDVYSNIFIKIEFMNAISGPSTIIKTSNKNTIQPVNFAAHMLFDRQTSILLSDEIDNTGEDLCLYINVHDADNNRICGQASVFLNSMIESSTSLLRQEIEVVEIDDNDNNIGTIIVDIRGYQLLKRCA